LSRKKNANINKLKLRQNEKARKWKEKKVQEKLENKKLVVVKVPEREWGVATKCREGKRELFK
jgi:hypothetical protein